MIWGKVLVLVGSGVRSCALGKVLGGVGDPGQDALLNGQVKSLGHTSLIDDSPFEGPPTFTFAVSVSEFPSATCNK